MLFRALGGHLKELGWVFFLVCFILGCVYLIFGRHLGYETMIWICLAFALIVMGLFVMIVLGEILLFGILKMRKYFRPGG